MLAQGRRLASRHLGARLRLAFGRAAARRRHVAPSLAPRTALVTSRYARVIPPPARVVAAAKRRESNKMGVLYSGESMLATTQPLPASTLLGGAGYKTAILYGSRFGCRRSNVVRRARMRNAMRRGTPRSAERGRRRAVASLNTRAVAPSREQALRATIFGFPQLFQHPPAPQSCGGRRRPAKEDEKRASSQAWKLFSLAYRPDKCHTANVGCLGRRSGLP